MLKPLIPAHLAFLALALGAALFGAGQYLPAPYSLVAAALGSVALFLGGLGWRAPAWAAGKPMLPATLVPLALAGAGLLEQFSGALPANAQPYAVAVGGLLALLAGKLLPEPMKAVPAAPSLSDGTPLVPDTTVVQVASTCSLAQAAQGKC
ncbi:hypothetical protein D7X74_21295 [Corallococcus sp. CA047B]|uniref:hypothetical protein n=1 Tax=Corallococcus sp. CA047B TaxID=2316729 RepID=UPI000EA1E25A|nr:hypothetical protein [Corallococcus sp. CA047B]RKH13785.1 hypothetical protein D7X74_21295 [Corallococcus sp. CA047B]